MAGHAAAAQPEIVPGWPVAGGPQVQVTPGGNVLTLQGRRLDARSARGVLLWRTVLPADLGDRPTLRVGTRGEIAVGNDDVGVQVSGRGVVGAVRERCPSPVFGPDGTRYGASPYRYVESCDAAGNVRWGVRWGPSGLTRVGAADPALVPAPDLAPDPGAPAAVIATTADAVYVGIPAGATPPAPGQRKSPGRLVALAAADGATRWSRDLLGSPDWIAVAPDGTVEISDRGQGGWSVRGFAADGTPRFSVPLSGAGYGIAMGRTGLTYIVDGTDAFGFGPPFGQPAQRRLRAVLTDGTVTVSRAFSGSELRLLGVLDDGSLVAADGTGGRAAIGVGGPPPQLRGLTSEGRDRWTMPAWGASGMSAAVQARSGTVYVGDWQTVHAIRSRAVSTAPPPSRATLRVVPAAFRVEGPSAFCAVRKARRCVRQAAPLGTMLRIDLPNDSFVQVNVARLDGNRRPRLIDGRLDPIAMPRGTGWLPFPECCLRRLLPSTASPTLPPGRYRITLNVNSPLTGGNPKPSAVVRIEAPPKGFRRPGVYDS